MTTAEINKYRQRARRLRAIGKLLDMAIELMIVISITLFLFFIASLAAEQARGIRGAFGGEYVFLLLPVAWYAFRARRKDGAKHD